MLLKREGAEAEFIPPNSCQRMTRMKKRPTPLKECSLLLWDPSSWQSTSWCPVLWRWAQHSLCLSMPISCSPAKDLLPHSIWSQHLLLASSLQPPALPLSTAWSDVLIPSMLFCHLCHFRVDSWPCRFGRACSQCVWADAWPSLLFPPNLVPNHQPYFMDHPKAPDCQNNFNYSGDGPRATSSIRGLPAADKD